MPNKKDKTGRRVQIYLPADLLAQWDATPRYERSAEVAAALREWWQNRAILAQSRHTPPQPPENTAS